MKYKIGDMVNILGEEGTFEILEECNGYYRVYDKVNKRQYDMVNELGILPLRDENKLIWNVNSEKPFESKLNWHSYKEKPTEGKQYLCYVLEPDNYGLFEEKYYVIEWILEEERWEFCWEGCVVAWAEINRPEINIRN